MQEVKAASWPGVEAELGIPKYSVEEEEKKKKNLKQKQTNKNHWNRLLLVFGVSILGDIQNPASMALGILFIDPALSMFLDQMISRGAFQHRQFWENWAWAWPSTFIQAIFQM